MQKGIAPIVWVILAAIVLGGGYFAYRKYQQPTTDYQQQEGEENTGMEGWKTYRNEKYGFEFRYPAGWFIQDNLSETTCCLNVTNTALLSERPKPDEVKIQVQRYTKSASMGLKEFVMNSDPRGTKMENVTIGNTQGVKTNALGDGIYFLPQSNVTGVGIIVFGHPETSASVRQQVSQILSTFRLTNLAASAPQENSVSESEIKPERISTEGWNEYRSPSNFIFDYPPSFTLMREETGPFLQFSSPSCDFLVLPVFLEVEEEARRLDGIGWRSVPLREKVAAGTRELAAVLRYNEDGALQLIQADGYLPGIRMVMGTKSESVLSPLCINQFVTILSTLIP